MPSGHGAAHPVPAGEWPEAPRPARPPLLRGEGRTVAVVAAGGAVGASARYGAALLWPTGSDAFPWATFAVNATGCLLMGVLMVVMTELRVPYPLAVHPLVRPFLGTGVLGGFTTFSTYVLDIQRLVEVGEFVFAAGALVLTPVTALLAVWAGSALTRRCLGGGS